MKKQKEKENIKRLKETKALQKTKNPEKITRTVSKKSISPMPGCSYQLTPAKKKQHTVWWTKHLPRKKRRWFVWFKQFDFQLKFRQKTEKDIQEKHFSKAKLLLSCDDFSPTSNILDSIANYKVKRRCFFNTGSDTSI